MSDFARWPTVNAANLVATTTVLKTVDLPTVLHFYTPAGTDYIRTGSDLQVQVKPIHE